MDRPGTLRQIIRMRRRTISLRLCSMFLAAAALAGLSGEPARVGENGLGFRSHMVTVRPLGPGRFATELTVAGHLWNYQIEVPPRYAPNEPLPLVVVLHGAGLSGGSYLEQAGWAEKARREGFLVVAPDGLPNRPGFETSFWLNPRLWNSGQHPGAMPRRQIDDLAFFQALLDDVMLRWPVDSDRVYVVGHSNGGAMAFRLGIEMSDRFAAVASVSGLNYVTDRSPETPRPTLFITGTADPILPIEGGSTVLPWGTRVTPPVRENLDALARDQLGASALAPVVRLGDGIVTHEYAAGPSGASLTAIYLEGHGHSWPGPERFGPVNLLGPHNPRLNAVDPIWDFLSRHRRASTSEIPSLDLADNGF